VEGRELEPSYIKQNEGRDKQVKQYDLTHLMRWR